MKRRIAAWIVRKRKLILLLMLVLAAAAVFGIPLTRINYDLNRYLSDDTMTKRSLQVMTEEFGSSEQLRVMFADLPEEELTEALTKVIFWHACGHGAGNTRFYPHTSAGR